MSSADIPPRRRRPLAPLLDAEAAGGRDGALGGVSRAILAAVRKACVVRSFCPEPDAPEPCPRKPAARRNLAMVALSCPALSMFATVSGEYCAARRTSSLSLRFWMPDPLFRAANWMAWAETGAGGSGRLGARQGIMLGWTGCERWCGAETAGAATIGRGGRATGGLMSPAGFAWATGDGRPAIDGARGCAGDDGIRLLGGKGALGAITATAPAIARSDVSGNILIQQSIRVVAASLSDLRVEVTVCFQRRPKEITEGRRGHD